MARAMTLTATSKTNRRWPQALRLRGESPFDEKGVALANRTPGVMAHAMTLTATSGRTRNYFLPLLGGGEEGVYIIARDISSHSVASRPLGVEFNCSRF